MPPSNARWWIRELATVCDPISLDPIRTLKYPPFELRADNSLTCADSDWYDGAVLASYLVSTGNFTHPISRRELGRDECEALDAYLREHRLPGGGAAKAYTSRRTTRRRPPPDSQLGRMRAEADQILQSLFSSSAARRTAGANNMNGPAAVVNDGNMSLIDDDQMPSHASSAVAGSTPAAADAVNVSDDVQEESFPGLPPSGAPLGGGGGLRYTFGNPVRSAWAQPQQPQQPQPQQQPSGEGGWRTVPSTSNRPAQAASSSSSGGGSSSNWSAAAARQNASIFGTAHSLGRTPTSATLPPRQQQRQRQRVRRRRRPSSARRKRRQRQHARQGASRRRTTRTTRSSWRRRSPQAPYARRHLLLLLRLRLRLRLRSRHEWSRRLLRRARARASCGLASLDEAKGRLGVTCR